MNTTQEEKEAIGELKQVFVAFAAALVSSLVLSFAQYLGAHIPQLLHLLGTFAGSYTTIKIYK